MHLRFDGLLQLHRSKQGWWSRWGTLRLPSFLQRLTLNQQFMLASLVILVSGMGGIGAWVGEQISNGVVHRTAATTALYVDSFVAPELQDLAKSSTITPEHVSGLNQLRSQTPLGHTIAAFKVGEANGRVR